MSLKPGQQKCINTLDRSLVVAAGAGSGKTFTLTKRIVHAIQSGAVDGIQRVCAITFTNKAAGELKSRVKSELRSCGLLEQALMVDEAWVSTIHGMCARILRSHAIELDIDPSFQMIDGIQAESLQEQSVNAVLQYAQFGFEGVPGDVSFDSGTHIEDATVQLKRQFGTINLPEVAAIDALFAEYPARSFGQNSASVQSMLQTLMEYASGNPQGCDAFVVSDAKVNCAALIFEVLDAFGMVVAAVPSQKRNEQRDGWAASTDAFISAARKEVERRPFGRNEGDDLAWALTVLDGFTLPKRVGSADYKELAGAAIAAHRQAAMRIRLAIAAPHLDTLIGLTRASAGLYQHLKRSRGVLDNNDLLVLAYRAIVDHPDIAACYTDKFQLIMVDEFQDTDQMQVDMIKLLAGPGACRLCTVGDAQQSIYRFRGADVSVYRRHLDSVRAQDPDSVILLPDNFRSHSDVLAFVDRVFERPSMFGKEFMSLAAGRDEVRVKRPLPDGTARIQVQLTSNSRGGVTPQSARECAAARIADAFASLKERHYPAGDMAILLGSMKHADAYARALRQHGLACVISGGSVFSQMAEPALVADLLRVIANPYQTDSLFNVMTSPLFQLCADDLLALATDFDEAGNPLRSNLCKGLMNAVAQGANPATSDTWSAQLELAVRVLGEMLAGARRSRPSRLVMQVIAESGWLARMQQAGPEGLAQAANMYKAIRLIEDIEKSSAAGPAQVSRRYDILLAQSKEAPGALSATGGDFVRIMTVHASKGLEFPIVAVAEFKQVHGDSSRLLASSVDGLIHLSLDVQGSLSSLGKTVAFDGLPLVYASVVSGEIGDDYSEEDACALVHAADDALVRRAALFEYGRLGDEEESKRLLYVALTRAKEALVVSLAGTRTKDNPRAIPANRLGAVVSALAGEDVGFEEGASLLAFGGSAPAYVDHVALSLDEDDGERIDEDACPKLDAQSDGEDPPARDGSFMVPAPEERPHWTRTPYAPAHAGIFSYSSIAAASHDGDILRQLADLSRATAEGALPHDGGGLCAAGGESSGDVVGKGVASGYGEDGQSWGEGFHPNPHWANRSASVYGEDDGSWAYSGSSIADADKATDLGTAFHRLAQLAVRSRGMGPLVCPDESRIDALSQTLRLDVSLQMRLRQALDRWFGSDLSKRVCDYAEVSAEVPFLLELADGQNPSEAFLEGEIDLLALSEDRSKALVVDYKTGGSDDGQAEALELKHVLQASCYACAVMRQGIGEVEAVFARVEWESAQRPGQPQCVCYRFTADQLPLLEQAIVCVRRSGLPHSAE